MSITRLAPSPTGALHLGNARTFLVNWLLARQQGWKIILRIEDLDGPRVKRGAAEEAMEDLRWLGLDWDEGPIYQSQREDRYRTAIQQLMVNKCAYACVCTRREAELASSAPHVEDGAGVYPGTCRGRFASLEEAERASGRRAAVRFNVDQRVVEFKDAFAGAQKIDVELLGDFVIAKADGTAAYQLAVVVDDADMNISDIVRGDDLLESAARQMVLYEALGWGGKTPRWMHLPLVVGPDGKRLAKRHGDSRLSYYRQKGVTAGRVRALIARWCGMGKLDEIGMTELLQGFSLAKMPRERFVFSPAEHVWLLEKKA